MHERDIRATTQFLTMFLIYYCCCLHQELVDGDLLNQLSPRTCDLVPVLTQLLIPPTEIDGAVLKQKCAQINKALEVLNDILVTCNLNRCIITHNLFILLDLAVSTQNLFSSRL